jgi:hypothetical protein
MSAATVIHPSHETSRHRGDQRVRAPLNVGLAPALSTPHELVVVASRLLARGVADRPRARRRRSILLIRANGQPCPKSRSLRRSVRTAAAEDGQYTADGDVGGSCVAGGRRGVSSLSERRRVGGRVLSPGDALSGIRESAPRGKTEAVRGARPRTPRQCSPAQEVRAHRPQLSLRLYCSADSWLPADPYKDDPDTENGS